MQSFRRISILIFKKILPHSELHISDHIVCEVFGIPEELSLDSVGMSGPMHWRFTAESYQTELRSHLVVL